MKTVKDALLAFNEGLKLLYDKAEINTVAYTTVMYITKLSKVQLRAFPETELSDKEVKSLAGILSELQSGKPVQYVLGETEFYGLPFKVNPSVLIPRPETEELVEWIISSAKERNRPESILDIGTGSGCIPVTLKNYLPSAKLSAIDISKDALKIARQNAKLNEVEIQFSNVDILNPTKSILRNTYSILVSNPPYVTGREKTEMHTNVLNHEPHIALFVPDDDPLLFYNAIANFALKTLEDNGLLFFEINENYGKQTVELLQAKGFKNIQLRQDIRGKERMIKASK